MPGTEETAQVLEGKFQDLPGAAAAPTLPAWLIVAAFSAALSLLACIAVLSYYSARLDVENNRWVDHTYQVINVIESLLQDQSDTAGVVRGYVLTGDKTFLDTYHRDRAREDDNLLTLERLTADNPAQQANILRLKALIMQRLQMLDALIAGSGTTKQLLDSKRIAEVSASHQMMDTLRAQMGDMTQEERGLLVERNTETQRSQHRLILIVVIGNALSLATLLLCLLLLTREIRTRRGAEASVQALNAELSERAALLELANRELEGFSYSISHDLRSPLRAIDGFSQILERTYAGVLDAEGIRLLGVVRTSSKRMGELIEDLLAFSRLGRKAVEMRALDTQQLVREAIAEVLADTDARPEIVTGVLPACLGDRALVKQVWINLIGNAVKYSSHSAPARIEISGREEEGHVVYTVRDNGVGFDMQYYGKLFGVFQRLHGVDEFPGTGVGLAIVMRIVTRHAGRTWAESVLGEGAAFHFSLPRKEDDHE